MILDTALISIIGMKQYYVLYRKVFVTECKNAGLSQSQTLTKLNKELNSEGQKTVTLSLVKYLWS